MVPAFQALRTLPAVLEGAAAWGLPILVVDDGSTDGSAAWLAEWAARDPAARSLLALHPNGGKARALQAAFRLLAERGVRHAITIDADGQHDPADGPALLAAAAADPEAAVVCGRRSLLTDGYPRRRMTGRVLNDMAIRAQTGVTVEDSPCGFRVYPLRAVAAVRCRSGRFAWEEEFLTRAVWAGYRLVSVPIRCIYRKDEPGAPASHYRFRRDWPEGVAINLWLMAAALGPVRAACGLGWQLRTWLRAARISEAWRGPAPVRLHAAAALLLGAVAGGAAGVAGALAAGRGEAGPIAAPGVETAAVAAGWGWASLRWHASAWHAAAGFAAGWLLGRAAAAGIRLIATG